MKKIILAIMICLATCLLTVGLIACDEEGPHTHKYIESITAPTCTEGGYTTHTCSCGESYTDNRVMPKGHNYTQKSTAPTCTEQGYTTFTCLCGDSYVDNNVKALGHNFTDYVSNNDASYEADGTKTAVCNREGCYETDTLIDIGTKFVKLQRVEFEAKELEIEYGKTEMLVLSFFPEETTNKNVTYVSSAPTIVQVENGVAFGAKEGSAVITATSEDGEKIATCTISVYKIKYQLAENKGSYFVEKVSNFVTEMTVPNIYKGLRVAGIGKNAFENCSELASVTLPNTIEYIDSNAFSNCISIETITIPESVITIGNYAFSGCSLLKEIEVKGNISALGAYAFADCVALESANLQGELLDIYTNCFYNCIKLKDLTLGSNLRRIYASAFENCTSLDQVTLPESLTELGEGAFKNATSLKRITLSPLLTAIENVTFQGCTALESIEILQGIQSIGVSAFSNCSSLNSISILGNVLFGKSAFYRCENLESIYFNSKTSSYYYTDENFIFYNAGINKGGINLTLTNGAYVAEKLFTPCIDENQPKITKITIEENATGVTIGKQSELPYLTTVYIPETLSITEQYDLAGEKIFSIEGGIKYLGNVLVGVEKGAKNVTISSSVTQIFSNAFAKNEDIESVRFDYSTQLDSIYSKMFEDCTNLRFVNIPDSITKIESYAFNNCVNLNSVEVTYANNLESIGEYAFNNCGKLESFNIPDSVTTLGSSVFTNCVSLNSISLGTVESIPSQLFNGCIGLENIYIPSSVSTISSDAFAGCTNLKSVSFDSYSQLSTIYGQTFAYSYYLESVILPTSVTSIQSYAFNGVSNLAVYYYGDESDWNNISFGSYCGLESAKVYYYSSSAPVYTVDNLANEREYWFYGDVPTVYDKEIFSISGFNSSIIGGYTASGNWSSYSDGSLKSTNISDSRSTTYTVHITSNGIFSFSYRTSSEASYDELIVHKNNTQIVSASGVQGGFTQHSEEVVNGDVITFTYSKDGSQSDGDDAVYIKLYGFTTYSASCFGNLFGGEDNSAVPSSIKEVLITGEWVIPSAFFMGCENITKVTIDYDAVTQIGENAFKDCTNLTRVVMGSGVSSIGAQAFSNCNKLTKIIYYGFMSDWDALPKGVDWDYGTGDYVVSWWI